MSRLRTEEVLKYTKKKRASGTVRRHFLKWRKAKGIRYRCDESTCVFYTQPLEWNGRPLILILDHINGNNSDDRVVLSIDQLHLLMVSSAPVSSPSCVVKDH